MKIVEVLTKAKALIVNPENWTQEEYTNSKGCFCALGAIAEVSEKNEAGEVSWFSANESKAGRFLRDSNKEWFIANGWELNGTSFAVFNDSNTHTEVMEAFDKAIQLAQAEEV